MAIPIKAVLSVSTAGFKTAMSGATKVLGGFVAIAKAASLALVGLTAAFAALVLRQSALIDRLGKVSKVTGVAVETLQRFGFAAELAGVSTDQAQIALRRFSRRLGEAQKNTGELAPTLRRLGIDLRDSNGEFKNAEEVLFELADGIANTEGASAKLSIAFKAFDSEGAELVNTLNKGGDALRRVFDEADALGFVLNRSAVQGVENFRDELTKLGFISSGIASQFTAALAPALKLVTEDFVNFLKTAAAERGGFESLGNYLKFEFFNVLIVLTEAFGKLFNIFVGLGNTILSIGRELGLFKDEAGDTAEALKILQDLDIGPTFNLGPILADLLNFKTVTGDVKDILEEVLGDAGMVITDEERLAAIAELEERLKGLQEQGPVFQEMNVDALVEYLRKLRDAEPLVITINKGVEDQRTIWQKIIDFLDHGVENLKAFQTLTVDWANTFENVATRLGTPMERLQKTIEDGLVTGVEKFEDTLTDAILTGKADFSDLGEHIKKVFAKALVQRFITGPILSIFGLASGGPAKAGQPYIVGEEGPELFIPRNSGTVVPNDETMAMAGGQGFGMSAPTVNYNINAVDAQSFKQLVARDPEFIFNVTQAGARRIPG